MPKIIIPRDTIREIKLEDLMENVQFMRHSRLRLAQICAAWINNRYELSYSFVDESTYAMITLRVYVELDQEVPSIGVFYPYATFYENEMETMYGVHMRMMHMDYHTKLYRISKWAAMLPEDVRQKKIAKDKPKTVVPGASEQPDQAGSAELNAIVQKAVPLRKAEMKAMAADKDIPGTKMASSVPTGDAGAASSPLSERAIRGEQMNAQAIQAPQTKKTETADGKEGEQ